MNEGFYCYFENELFYAPNAVYNACFQLLKENHESYSYPVDGWYWFDNEEGAKSFFEI